MLEIVGYYYEVAAYKSASGMPYDMLRFKSKKDAFTAARGYIGRMQYVEINKVFYNSECPEDLFGDELIASWTDGKLNK